MKLDADAVLNPAPEINITRLNWDLTHNSHDRIEKYWIENKKRVLPESFFDHTLPISLEIGAGSGTYFSQLAIQNPREYFIAIEICRTRGKRLAHRTKKLALPNFQGVRGNAIPALINGIADQRIDKIYILYPCPWIKNSQRHNRWYLHTVMPHFIRILKKDGIFIWASDQKFYIDEARYICEEKYGLKVLSHGEVKPNLWNQMENTPAGRTKFEKDFMGQGLPCYELVLQKIKESKAD